MLGAKKANYPTGQNITSLTTLYHSISTLTLNDAIEIIANNNLGLLVKSGVSNEKDLNLVWVDIQQDYYQIIGSANQDRGFSLQKQYDSLVFKINICAVAFNAFMVTKDIFYKKVLNGYGFYWDNGLSDDNIILQFNGFVKSFEIDLQIIEEQVSKMVEDAKGASNEKPKRQMHLSNIAVLSKYIGFHIDRNKTSYEEYAIMIKQHNDYVEAQIKMNKQNG